MGEPGRLLPLRFSSGRQRRRNAEGGASRALALAVSALLLLLPATSAFGQYFGRNKVQWEGFDFHVLSTEHFDIHYYPPESDAVRDAARMAERWYARLSETLGHRFSGRKPLILYADHADFQQTTVVGGLIGEGVGGFTEPLRHRLVMPMTGSYAATDHVLGHEIVHVFQFDMAEQRRDEARGSLEAGIPLWMIEGLAEYLSLGRESPHTALWLRDALLRDDLPTFKKLGSDPRYFPYRFGHAFWAFVGGRWGDEAVARLFREALGQGATKAFETVLGLSAKDTFKAWHQAIREAYVPVVASREASPLGIKPLLARSRTDARLNVAPSISPDGSKVAFLSSRDLFSVDLYLADARTGEMRGKLLSASKDPHLEALRFIDSAGAWSPDGRSLALVVVSKGDDRIVVVDVGKRKISRKLVAPGIGAITDPAWAPDGGRIAFSGSTSGVSDLYVLEPATGAVRKLTADRYADLQPAWSPDGRTIGFVSDRGPGTSFEELRYGPLGICLLDVESGRVRRLDVFEGAKHISPQFSPDGKSLYFIADPDGVPDVYRLALDDGEVRRITRAATGVSGITETAPALSVARDTGHLAFSVFRDSGYEVYRLEPERAAGEAVAAGGRDHRAAILPPAAPSGASAVSTYLANPKDGLPREPRYPEREYRPSLRLAFVGPPTIGFSTSSFGTAVGGGVSAYFTDILGGHQLGIAVEGGSSSEFGNTFAAQAVYLNQTRRLNWGGLAARIPFLTTSATSRRGTFNGSPATFIDQFLEEVTVAQAGGLAQYPFSTRRRVEVNAVYTRYDTEVEGFTLVLTDDGRIFEQPLSVAAPQTLDLYQTSMAFVGDSSHYGFTSPLRGVRYRLELGSTTGSLRYQTALADARRYLFPRPVAVGLRVLFLGRYGHDAESDRLVPLFVGRENLVRGYRAGSFDASECTPTANATECPEFDRLLGSRMAVANLELRLPVLGTEELGLARFPQLPLEVAIFVDVGVAWTRDASPSFKFERETAERVPVFSYGLATRLLLGGYVPIEIYYAVPLQRPARSRVLGFFFAPGW